MDRMATREHTPQGGLPEHSFAQENTTCARQVCWLPMDTVDMRPHSGEATAEEAGCIAERMTLRQLSDSINKRGLMNPITVRERPSGRFEIVSGNRRYLACRMNGATHIDAIVLPGAPDGRLSATLIARMQAGHMHYLEDAQACKRLLNEGITKEELARCLGRTAAEVARRAKLWELDDELRRFLLDHDLSEGYARALSKLPDRLSRMSIARQTVAQKLCVRDVDVLVAAALKRLPVPPPTGGRTISLIRDHRLYLNAIRSIIAQMQEAGIAAEVTQMKFGSHVELMVSIPTRARRTARVDDMPLSADSESL